MLVNKTSEREWSATDYPGIERSLFRNNETGGRSSVVRLGQGSRFPRHAHQGTEEVVVLSGAVRIGGVELSQGDYLFTSPGRSTTWSPFRIRQSLSLRKKATPVVE